MTDKYTNYSFIISITTHALLLLCCLYFFKAGEPSTYILENVDLIEIESAPIPQEINAEKQSRTIFSKIKNFFKPEEPALKDSLQAGKIAPIIPEDKLPQTRLKEKLQDRGRMLASARNFTPSSQEQIQDTSSTRVLEEVGRKAVRNANTAAPLVERTGWQKTGSSLPPGVSASRTASEGLSGMDKNAAISGPSAGSNSIPSGYHAETAHASQQQPGSYNAPGKTAFRENSGQVPMALAMAKPVAADSNIQDNTVAGAKENSASSNKANKRVIFQITGQLANRKVLSKVFPVYPEWAQKQGMEFSCTLLFFVLSDGIVKDNIVTYKTSGDVRIDKSAIKALSTWRFVPLSSDRNGEEQWGYITFNFSF